MKNFFTAATRPTKIIGRIYTRDELSKNEFEAKIRLNTKFRRLIRLWRIIRLAQFQVYVGCAVWLRLSTLYSAKVGIDKSLPWRQNWLKATNVKIWMEAVGVVVGQKDFEPD